jgi:hypothetical protein
MNNNDLQPLLDLPSGEDVFTRDKGDAIPIYCKGSNVLNTDEIKALALELQKLRALLAAAENEAEATFKRQFAIQWLAAIEAVNYQDNCHRGWKDHSPPVEDAYSLADSVWSALEAFDALR